MLRFRAWIPPVAWAALLFGLSSIPGDRLPPVSAWWQPDKLVHGGLYLVLGLLVTRALRRTARAMSQEGLLLAAVALSALYGISDEVHQLWTPRRSADWRDAVADALGALLGAVLAIAVTKIKPVAKKPAAP
jgi:VanZ family protein